MQKVSFFLVLLLAGYVLTACGAPAPIIVIQPEQQAPPQVVVIQPGEQQQPSTSEQSQTDLCSSLRSTHFAPGMEVRIAQGPSNATVLHTAASWQSRDVGHIFPLSYVWLLDGPYCDPAGFLMWHAKVDHIRNVYWRPDDVPDRQFYSVYVTETDISGEDWLILH